MTGVQKKTGASFGTLKMESWLRFDQNQAVREITSCTGGEDGAVQVWGLPQVKSNFFLKIIFYNPGY